VHIVFYQDTGIVALFHQATMSNRNNADNLQGSQCVAKSVMVQDSLLLLRILL